MDVLIKPAPLSGEIAGIASKSYAHRALICAAVSQGISRIKINSSSQDIEATEDCLRRLGARIIRQGDCCTVTPIEKLPQEVKIDCSESGSTLRFVLPLICALGIKAEITGKGRLPERPLSPLREELCRMGAEISEGFPLKIGGKIKEGEYSLRGDVSSQFVSGLLMALPLIEGESSIRLLPPVQSRPYIDMTVQTLKSFGARITESGDTFYIYGAGRLKSADFTVQADWSNAAFWLCSGVGVTGLDSDSAQGDREIISVLRAMGAKIEENAGVIKAELSDLHGSRIDASQIPDLVPVVAAIAASAKGQTVIYNAERLRLKESDRLQTTAAMLTDLGADIAEKPDGLVINGRSSLKGGATQSFGDHRIAMAAAVAAQKCVESVTIGNAEAVAKSYPDFFKDYNRLGGNACVL